MAFHNSQLDKEKASLNELFCSLLKSNDENCYELNSGINEFREMADKPGVRLEIFKAGEDWRDQKWASPWSVALFSFGQGGMQAHPLLCGQAERRLLEPEAGKAFMLLAGFLERFLVAVAIRTAQPFRFHCPPPVPYYMDSRLPSLEAPVLFNASALTLLNRRTESEAT
ncbi:hypothetical protein T4E_5881 [Trichinella pseudospiralis]|uniref:Uncharacterized protein n=1 Tax=Trichinella pseudospiralis TaxID=6337 RepID=A0A0V0XDW0_TRIPS|nr:hypothetical protein T4E_5881 [Trichinella pseudospiralis]